MGGLDGIESGEKEAVVTFNEEGCITIKKGDRKMKKNPWVQSEDEIVRIVANVNATMRIEGFKMTEEELMEGRMILRGEADAEELIAKKIREIRKEQSYD